MIPSNLQGELINLFHKYSHLDTLLCDERFYEKEKLPDQCYWDMWQIVRKIGYDSMTVKTNQQEKKP